MYYPHPLIARRMRRFQILRQPWRRYVAATDPVAKAFAERQYREAESAYRLMASYNQPAERPTIVYGIGQFVHMVWDAFK
jgi:hypothetical protein